MDGLFARLEGDSGIVAANRDLDDAAMRRAGAVRVMTYAQLFAVARLLAMGKIARGNRLAIVTNGHAPGILAADIAWDRGIPLAKAKKDMSEFSDVFEEVTNDELKAARALQSADVRIDFLGCAFANVAGVEDHQIRLGALRRAAADNAITLYIVLGGGMMERR